MGNRLGEHRGIISTAVVSSTNLIRPCQSFNSGLTKIANSIGPSFAPCGRPPLAVFHDEVYRPILTHCYLFVIKGFNQPYDNWMDIKVFKFINKYVMINQVKSFSKVSKEQLNKEMTSIQCTKHYMEKVYQGLRC